MHEISAELFGGEICLERLKKYELTKIIFSETSVVDYLAGSRPLLLQTKESEKMDNAMKAAFLRSPGG